MTGRIGGKIWGERKPWADIPKQAHWNWQTWLDIAGDENLAQSIFDIYFKIKNICENWEKENIFDILYLNILSNKVPL